MNKILFFSWKYLKAFSLKTSWDTSLLSILFTLLIGTSSSLILLVSFWMSYCKGFTISLVSYFLSNLFCSKFLSTFIFEAFFIKKLPKNWPYFCFSSTFVWSSKTLWQKKSCQLIRLSGLSSNSRFNRSTTGSLIWFFLYGIFRFLPAPLAILPLYSPIDNAKNGGSPNKSW